MRIYNIFLGCFYLLVSIVSLSTFIIGISKEDSIILAQISFPVLTYTIMCFISMVKILQNNTSDFSYIIVRIMAVINIIVFVVSMIFFLITLYSASNEINIIRYLTPIWASSLLFLISSFTSSLTE